jgi:hypothetical protein
MHAIIHLSKSAESGPSVLDPNVIYRLQVMYQCQFIIGEKCTILEADVDYEGRFVCIGLKDIGNPCTFLLILFLGFALKTVLNNKCI